MKPLFFSKHLRVLSYRLSSILQDRRAVRPSGLRAEDCRKPSTEAREHRNRQNRPRFVLSVSLASMVSSGSVLAERSPQAVPPSCQHVNVPPADAATAITELARQTGAKLLFPYKLAKAQQARPVIGCFSLQQALALLLDGTQLASGLSDKGVLTIAPAGSDVFVTKRHNNGEETMKKNMRKNVLAAVVGVFAAGSGGVFGQEGSEDSLDWLLEEVVVTATKRGAGTSIQDTAMAISALGADTIEKRGLVGMDDYLRTLPGVDFQDRGAGQNTVIIRGVGSDPQVERSVTGVYFGETPLSGLNPGTISDASGNGDVKLVDIERIEVLRGPQGTLYGSGSMGGTLRILPKAPNLQEFEGSINARYSLTGEEGDDNNMVQAVVNLPLIEDTLALRAVAYRFENSGYYKNVGATDSAALTTVIEKFFTDLEQPNPLDSGAKPASGDNIGGDEYTGFRISALWQASDKLDLTFSYLHQNIQQFGFPETDVDLDTFEQVRFAGPNGEEEQLENDLYVSNLVVNYDLGWGTLTSSTSLVKYDSRPDHDVSFAFFGPFYEESSIETENFIEELRLVSSLDGPLQFVAGAYYEKNESDLGGDFTWSGVDLGFDLAFINDTQREVKQKAWFGELSYDFTESLTATIGARRFDYEDHFESQTTFIAPPFDTTDLTTDDEDETYKANLSYSLNEDTLIYGQWTQGFRLGQTIDNAQIQANCDNNDINGNPNPDGLIDDVLIPAPDSVNPDALDSYEIGLKTAFAENRVIMNVAVYYIEWEGIPVSVFLPSCGNSLTLNAGRSVSEGLEVEFQTQLLPDLKADLSLAYSESTLDEEHPQLGDKGDDLPGSADFNASIGLEYEFELVSKPAFVRADYTYNSGYFSNIAKIGPESGDYHLLNLKTGIVFGRITADLFANNVMNVDDFTGTEKFSGGKRGYRLRPRTFGLNVGYQF